MWDLFYRKNDGTFLLLLAHPLFVRFNFGANSEKSINKIKKVGENDIAFLLHRAKICHSVVSADGPV